MNTPLSGVGLNSGANILKKSVAIAGKKIDPLSGGILNTDSFFLIKPGQKKGIRFHINDQVIPYNKDNLEAFDSPLGRMMRLSNKKTDIQIVLVEHLLSALHLLGISDAEIILDESCFGPLTSTKIPIFGLQKPTYWIPVLGPGIEGFVRELQPFCAPGGEESRIVRVARRKTYEIIDPRPKYKGIMRKMSLEPSDRLVIQVDSAHQPDIKNNPGGIPISVEEGQNIDAYLGARPIMRLHNRFEEAVLFLLNLRSFALTRETYFRSRNSMSPEQVVERMHPIFQEGKNEHFYHTALADFPGELAAFMQGNHLHARIILSNTNHLFRMEALRVFFANKSLFKKI